jgi:hypothetical protein
VILRIHPNGSVDVSLAPNWFGEECVRFRAVDPAGLAVEAELMVYVAAVNDPPQLTPLPPQRRAKEGETIEVHVHATDVDSWKLTYSFFEIPGGEVRDNVWCWHTTYRDAGKYRIKVIVSDGFLSSFQEFEVVVENVNLPPRAKIAMMPAASVVKVGEVVYFRVAEPYDLDEDLDANGKLEGIELLRLTYFWEFGDGTNATGMEVGHKYGAPGNYMVTLEVRDRENGSAHAKLAITVEYSPVAGGEPPQYLLIAIMGICIVTIATFATIIIILRARKMKARAIKKNYPR